MKLVRLAPLIVLLVVVYAEAGGDVAGDPAGPSAACSRSDCPRCRPACT